MHDTYTLNLEFRKLSTQAFQAKMDNEATTRDGRAWQPEYLVAIDGITCIGCGRCYKVCGRGVMTLKGVNADGDLVDLGDDEDDEIERKVMVMADAGACIGCGACLRVCPTDCQTHAAAV